MKQEWEILTLNNYLSEVHFPEGLPRGTTFSRTLPATDNLPKITIGLGLITQHGSQTSIEMVPSIRHARNVMLNTFINEVAEHYLKLSEFAPDQWQELLLLNLGYVKKLNHLRNTPMSNYVLFSSIPTAQRLPLLKKYGLHKIATIAAYGYTDHIGQILTTLDELNEELPEETNYGTLMNLLMAGVPVEDLHMAVQLPLEMVEEIYSNEQP